MSKEEYKSFDCLVGAQHGVLTRRQAAGLGLTRARIDTLLRYGLLDEPVTTVLRVQGSVRSWHQGVAVGVLAAGNRAVASHRCAARLHRLDGFLGSRVVEVSVSKRGRHQVEGVVAHHVTPLDDQDVTVIQGIRATTLARTLADLGAVVPAVEVQQALTDARRRRVDLLWLRETVERLHRPGPAGTGTLLRLLDAIPHEGQVPGSWLEELLAACVADRAIPEVIPQYEIRDASGILVAVTDLGIPAVRLGLEGHSRQYHFGPLQEPLDEQRDLRVAGCGWELLYLGWHAAHQPEQVVRTLRSVIRARRREL
jgi:hypothetical protein